MPSSHLPRTPCDKFVFDFPCDFLGIVGGYGLRHMCSHCLRESCNFFYGASGATWGKSVQRLCGDCTQIVQCQCSCGPVSAASARKSCGDRPSHGARAGIMHCHLRHVYGLRSYDFSKFVKLLAKPNRRGRGARESVRKSHSRLLPPQGGLAEAARKGGYGQDTGSVDPSQAKCELSISSSLNCCAVSAASARKSYRVRAASLHRLRGNGAVTVQPPCRFLRAAFARCPCGDCAMPPTTLLLRATGLRFVFKCMTPIYITSR